MLKTFAITTARTLVAVVTAFALFASLTNAPASAQAYPPGYAGHHQNLDGVVTYFNAFDMSLHVGPGQDIRVHLHQGTIINPTGTTLRRGMRVNIRGYQHRDGVLEADRIDFDGWARGGYHRY